MKSFLKARFAAGVALGAVLALSYVDSAFGADWNTAGRACPTNSYDCSGAGTAATPGIAAADFSDCCVSPGYYLASAASGSLLDDSTLTITVVPADYFSVDASTVVSSTTATDLWDGSAALTGTTSGVSACPTNSGTGGATGSDSLSDCVTDAGYMFVTADASDPTAVAIMAIPADSGIYTTGGQAVTDVGNERLWQHFCRLSGRYR